MFADQDAGGPAFVTGASGFIGRHLLRALLERNREVFALTRRPETLADFPHPSLHVLRGALHETASYLECLDRNTTVFHLAAIRSRPGIDEQEFQRVNETESIQIARMSLKKGVRKFVYLSSAVIFGPSPGETISEAVGPRRKPAEDHYIESRTRSFFQMNGLIQEGLPLVTLCPTIVFGPDHPSYPNKITSHIRRLLRSRIGVVTGDGLRKRNLVFVGDVIQGILLAENHDCNGEVFILGGEDVCHRAFNKMVFAIGACRYKGSVSIPLFLASGAARGLDLILRNDRRSGFGSALKTLTAEWQFSSQKAKRALGYESTRLDSGIQQTIAFIKSKNL